MSNTSKRKMLVGMYPAAMYNPAIPKNHMINWCVWEEDALDDYPYDNKTMDAVFGEIRYMRERVADAG